MSRISPIEAIEEMEAGRCGSLFFGYNPEYESSDLGQAVSSFYITGRKRNLMEEMKVTVETLKGGAALELFNEMLDQIAHDIVDQNKDACSVREAVVKIKVKPAAERDVATYSIIPSVKLGARIGVSTAAFIGADEDGVFGAYENNRSQGSLPLGRSDEGEGFGVVAQIGGQ